MPYCAGGEPTIPGIQSIWQCASISCPPKHDNITMGLNLIIPDAYESALHLEPLARMHGKSVPRGICWMWDTIPVNETATIQKDGIGCDFISSWRLGQVMTFHEPWNYLFTTYIPIYTHKYSSMCRWPRHWSFAVIVGFVPTIQNGGVECSGSMWWKL